MRHNTSIVTTYLSKAAAKRFMAQPPSRNVERYGVPDLLPRGARVRSHGTRFEGWRLDIRRAWRYTTRIPSDQVRQPDVPYVWYTEATLTGGAIVSVTIPRERHQQWVKQDKTLRLRPGWTEETLANAIDRLLMWALHETNLNFYRAQVMDLAETVKEGRVEHFREAAEAESKSSGRSPDPNDWDYDACQAWLAWLTDYKRGG